MAHRTIVDPASDSAQRSQYKTVSPFLSGRFTRTEKARFFERHNPRWGVLRRRPPELVF
jgi:hypothetical protein